jgi:predicted dehydrogenase
MTAIRVGVVGVGHLGRHHARILKAIDDVELVGVVDTRAEQAEAIAGPLGVPAFTDYRVLFDRVDAVSVAVPTTHHRSVAGAFLERGIATLVEKPLALTVEQGEELVAVAEQSGALLQVGHIERYNPIFETLQTLPIRPRYLAAERLSTYTFRSTDIGVVLDLMIHDIDLVLALIDSPVMAVSAVGTSVFGGAEDVASARVWFEDGTVADLSASRASLHATRKMRVWGREGYAGIDFKTRQALLVTPSESLKRGELSLDGVDLTQPDVVREHLFGRVLEVEHKTAEGREQLAVELEDFVRAVRTGSPGRVTGADGLRNLRLAELVIEGIENHPWQGVAVRENEAPPPSAIPSPHILRNRSTRKEPGRLAR